MNDKAKRVAIGRTTGGTFGNKLKNFIGTVGKVVGRYAPGTAGTIGNLVADIFNHPEWWQSHPGDPVTLNSPLAMVAGSGTPYPKGPAMTVVYPRAQYGVILSSPMTRPSSKFVDAAAFMPTEIQVNQFILPHVRAVVNAIPLQSVAAYRSCIMANAQLYAYWQTLKKWAYLAKHTPPYMSSFDDPAFPMLQARNAEKLQALIKRVYEALSANVRLPHTLCEYLAWRFGRVYKSTASAKAAYISYDALDPNANVSNITDAISAAIEFTSTDVEFQQANTDLFTVYASHDQEVHIAEDTQCQFDKKEWMLRINLNVVDTPNSGTTVHMDGADVPKAVIIDSDLDNATVFMSSTVSTVVPTTTPTGLSRGVTKDVLFPVISATAYYTGITDTPTAGELFQAWDNAKTPGTASQQYGKQVIAASRFYSIEMSQKTWGVANDGSVATYQPGDDDTSNESRGTVLGRLMACKSLDCYNMGVYLSVKVQNSTQWANMDVTAISMDMGMVPAETIRIEHNYALANLVDVHRARSQSKVALEKEALSETVAFVNEVTPSDTTVAKDVHPSL